MDNIVDFETKIFESLMYYFTTVLSASAVQWKSFWMLQIGSSVCLWRTLHSIAPMLYLCYDEMRDILTNLIWARRSFQWQWLFLTAYPKSNNITDIITFLSKTNVMVIRISWMMNARWRMNGLEKKLATFCYIGLGPYTLRRRDKDKDTFCLAKTKILPPWGERMHTTSAKITSSNVWRSVVVSGICPSEPLLEIFPW